MYILVIRFPFLFCNGKEELISFVFYGFLSESYIRLVVVMNIVSTLIYVLVIFFRKKSLILFTLNFDFWRFDCFAD